MGSPPTLMTSSAVIQLIDRTQAMRGRMKMKDDEVLPAEVYLRTS